MNLKDILKKLAEWVGLLGAMAIIGSLWINTEVERRMGELAKDPANAPAVVEIATKVDGLEAGQVRIETKVDAFSGKFLDYLERQASE